MTLKKVIEKQFTDRKSSRLCAKTQRKLRQKFRRKRKGELADNVFNSILKEPHVSLAERPLPPKRKSRDEQPLCDEGQQQAPLMTTHCFGASCPNNCATISQPIICKASPLWVCSSTCCQETAVPRKSHCCNIQTGETGMSREGT